MGYFTHLYMDFCWGLYPTYLLTIDPHFRPGTSKSELGKLPDQLPMVMV